MVRFLFPLAFSILATGAQAVAAESAPADAAKSKGYRMDVISPAKAADAVLNPETGVYTFTRADFTFLSDDPAQAPIRIRADSIKAGGGPGGEQFGKITAEGHVVISRGGDSITADKAVCDRETGLITFTGNPRADWSPLRGVRGSLMELNLETTRVRVKDLEADVIDISKLGSETPSPSAPTVLRAEDIRDWPGLLTKVKAQGAAAPPSPGKRIMSLLDSRARQQFQEIPADKVPSDMVQQMIVKQFARVLIRPDFYAEEAWSGISLRDETAALLKRKNDTKKPEDFPNAELIRLNRMLFEDAFPAEVAKSPGKPSESGV